MSKVLVLASYCGDDNKKCTDNNPCRECLNMCNVFHVPNGSLENYVAQFEGFKRGLGRRYGDEGRLDRGQTGKIDIVDKGRAT
jgi:hypothetical protein